jgi:hypothetical protein
MKIYSEITKLTKYRSFYIDDLVLPGLKKYIMGLGFHVFPKDLKWRIGSCLWSPCYKLYWIDIGPFLSITICCEELETV